ncbi:MAG TPA: ferredoxin, partial [Dehalococcoidia bacterium]|nr:ferredoxin [Dehalococcoidia bacterium]
MPYVVTDPCVGNKDLTCIDVCPVDCIYDGGDVDKMVYINVDEC